MKFIAVTLSACLFLNSCAARTVAPTTVHVEATTAVLEHDETISAKGAVTEFYPNKAAAREVIYRAENGAILDATCINGNCSDLLIKVAGSHKFPNGLSIQVLKTDDPNILMVRSGDGSKILGYATRDHGGTWKLLPDLEQAQAYEHHGDTARAVGKVALGALLIAGLVVAVAAAAAASAQANANANTVTTQCTSFGNSTTCTSR